MLRDFAGNPLASSPQEEEAQMTAAQGGLLRKFTDFAFNESAEMRWQQSMPTEADNIDAGPLPGSESQDNLMGFTGNPFWHLNLRSSDPMRLCST